MRSSNKSSVMLEGANKDILKGFNSDCLCVCPRLISSFCAADLKSSESEIRERRLHVCS